jgi:hypothetical protein
VLLALGIQAPFSAVELRRALIGLPRTAPASMAAEIVAVLARLGDLAEAHVIHDVTPLARIARDADTGYWLIVQPNDQSEFQGSPQNEDQPNPVKLSPTEIELCSLSMPGTDLATDVEIDLQLSLLAHNTLRRLARRLRGFEASSATYLRANFLESIATLSLTSDALRAQLTQPPLGMLLRLAGLGEYRYALPWWPEREIRVEMELPL